MLCNLACKVIQYYIACAHAPIYIFAHMGACANIYVYMYIMHVHLCTYVSVCVHEYACVCAFAHSCVCVCAYKT